MSQASSILGLYSFHVVPACVLSHLMPPGLCALGAWIAMDIDLALGTIVFIALYRRFFYKFARRLIY